ncbi:hypothetical protein HMI56_006461 [Coelomomyces lativittatus]|nr:hypothetical protein HMI56_006461 [Coelomomyces lativittatus]
MSTTPSSSSSSTFTSTTTKLATTTTTASNPSSLSTVQVKLVLLAAVGKSSLVIRFVRNEFQENREPTIGAAFLTQKCQVKDKIVKFEIWDTAGQERFYSLAQMYYRNAAAAVLVYDITSMATFERAKVWIKDLETRASPNIVIALAGNKLDLLHPDSGFTREVPTDLAQTYAKEAGLLFFETSAKDGTGVDEIFHSIGTRERERCFFFFFFLNPTSFSFCLDFNFFLRTTFFTII